MGEKVDHHESNQPFKLSHQVIKQITNDFDEALIVGRGGFGIVYKGIYNKEEIAVKIIKNMSGFDCKEFQKEFENLRKLKHQNVVQLKGFCNESEEVIAEYNGRYVTAEKMHTALCLEYVRNGTLAEHISVDGFSGHDWHIKYKIIKAICEGLQYLRHDLALPVLHMDLKPENILLDDNMIPKITDFGLSRLFGDENTKKTILKQGSLGYMPPEYIEHGIVSKSFDIFSLGVIIAKLMAGSDGYIEIIDMPEEMFVEHVLGNWRKKLGETLAPRQLEVYCEQVKMCIQLALKCMKRERQERPTIQFIVSNLVETEIMIGNLGLHMVQFRDEESILPKGGTAGNLLSIALDGPSNLAGNAHTRPPEMLADSSRRKTEDVKAGTVSAGLKELSLRLLKKITNDFSDERIISKSVLGTLYKGILEDGEVIAVKKLAEDSPVPHRKSFVQEIHYFTGLKHENVVKLIGFCHETYQKVVEKNGSYITGDIVETLLCYEYCPKGSLEKNLFEVPSEMGWETRFKIIKGICQGLLFIHTNEIVHLDLKPGNILLDNNMQPKIADFGLSRIFGQEQTRLCTQNVVGSIGYMAPEYLYRGEVSAQSDIYSLGVIILEITTRERNITDSDNPSARIYIDSVCKSWAHEHHVVSKYSSLDSVGHSQVKACIEVGWKCVEIDRRKRPSLERIVDRLEGNDLALEMPPPAPYVPRHKGRFFRFNKR